MNGPQPPTEATRRLRLVREYTIGLPLEGTPAWNALVERVTADELWEATAEPNVLNISVFLSYQADMGNESYPHADYRELAFAAEEGGTLMYDPKLFDLMLEPLEGGK
jgi:hypothetical protein